METIRAISGKDTVPTGTTGTGSATTHGSNNNWVTITGGDMDEFDSFLHNGKRNIWVYFTTAHKVFKLKSITPINSTTNFILVFEVDASGISADSFKIVEGDVTQFSCNETSGSSWNFDGATLAANSSFTEQAKSAPSGNNEYLDVKTVNGTLNVSEVRGF